LQFNVLEILAINDKYVDHVISEQLTRVADIDSRFCIVLIEKEKTLKKNAMIKKSTCNNNLVYRPSIPKS